MRPPRLKSNRTRQRSMYSQSITAAASNPPTRSVSAVGPIQNNQQDFARQKRTGYGGQPFHEGQGDPVPIVCFLLIHVCSSLDNGCYVLLCKKPGAFAPALAFAVFL